MRVPKKYSTPETKAFLFQLCSMVKGDPLAQVSMYEVGEFLGLEKTEAGALAEALFIEIQMLSPHPKTQIIRKILKSIAHFLSNEADLKGKLDALIAS